MMKDKLTDMMNKYANAVAQTHSLIKSHDETSEQAKYNKVVLKSYPQDDIKANVKHWNFHRGPINQFVAEETRRKNEGGEQENNGLVLVDLLVLGTGGSGKSTFVDMLEENGGEKIKIEKKGTETVNGTGSANNIQKVNIQGFELTVRELSYSFLKSWERYTADSRMILLMIDGTKLNEYAFAYLQIVRLMSGFDRPFVLLINKMDLVEVDRYPWLHEAREVLQMDRLCMDYPQLLVMSTSSFNEMHLGYFKGYVEDLMHLYGKKKDPKFNKKKASFCC